MSKDIYLPGYKKTGKLYVGHMLTEDDVVLSVVKYLKNKDYVIRSFCLAGKNQKGVDIDAEGPGGLLLAVEAKGQHAVKERTLAENQLERGGEFSQQSVDYYAYLAIGDAQSHARDHNRIAIALPRIRSYLDAIERVRYFYNNKVVPITIFWVGKKPECLITEEILGMRERGRNNGTA
jgi:hypothetical protein